VITDFLTRLTEAETSATAASDRLAVKPRL
jgi:hypothetical protein